MKEKQMVHTQLIIYLYLFIPASFVLRLQDMRAFGSRFENVLSKPVNHSIENYRLDISEEEIMTDGYAWRPSFIEN